MNRTSLREQLLAFVSGFSGDRADQEAALDLKGMSAVPMKKYYQWWDLSVQQSFLGNNVMHPHNNLSFYSCNFTHDFYPTFSAFPCLVWTI